jgi:hypothetical protein
VRKPVVALLVVALAAVAGIGAFGVWVKGEPEARFCTLGAPITPRNFELEGYEVMLQDSGDEPGPDECDGPDRPGRAPEDDDGGAEDLPPASSTSLPPGYVPTETLPLVVLGFDCRYRDADGEVVATATPNRPDGTCTIPDM